MSQLDLYLFGPPRLILGGKTVNIPRRKATALFAYLALTRRSHSRDALATLLWPENDQNSARAELRRSLYFINRAVGNEWLKTDRESAGLNPSTGGKLWVDVDEYQRQLGVCEAHNHPSTEICHDCIPHLEGAVELHTDHFMAGFSLPDSPAYDEWQFFQGENLRSQLAGALLRLSSFYSTRQDFETAITYARRWLNLDPLHEPAHQHLMKLFADSGQQAAALRQYQVCFQLLNEELGVKPSENTKTLYEEIRTNPVYRGVSPYSIRRPRHNLPAQSTPFIGREDELAEIRVLLHSSDCRLITLVGPGGSGKTRLALEAATRQISHYEHGGFFVSLAPVRSVNAITTTIAEAIGFSFYGGGKPLDQLLDYLRQKEMLILLDNYEHLLEGAPIITEIIAAAPNVQVLATSRIKLDLEGEHCFQVGGMSTPDSQLEDISSASQFSAIALFLDCAHRLQPTFTLTEENLGGVVHVCRLVSGMPLGIRLAVPWLEILTPAEIAIEINRNLDFLETSQRDLPQRQRSIRAAFDHSWNLLSDLERDVFQKMAVFRGGFTRQAAQTVIGVSLRELVTLVNKSLLQRTSSGRYEMHELLRQYAETKLGETQGTLREVCDRHSRYYGQALQGWRDELKGTRQVEALTEMDLEIHNIQTAWEWEVEGGQMEWIDQGMEALGLYYTMRYRHLDGENLFLIATKKLMGMDSGIETRILAKALAWRGAFHKEMLNVEFGIKLLKQSLSILEEIENSKIDDVRHDKAFTLSVLGHLFQFTESKAFEAKELIEESLQLYETLEDHWAVAKLQITRIYGGYFEYKQGLEKGLTILKELGDHLGMIDLIHWLGTTLWTLGLFEEAICLFHERLAIVQKMGDRFGIFSMLSDLSESYFRFGEISKSYALMVESLEIYDELGLGETRLKIYRNLVFCEMTAHLGQYELAKDLGQICVKETEDSDYYWVKGFSHFVLGLAELGLGTYKDAQKNLQKSVVFLQAHKENLSWSLAALGCAELGLGNNLQAKQHLLEMLVISKEMDSFFPLLYGLPAVALYLAGERYVERAVELYSLASTYGFVANSQWFEDVAGKHIAAIADRLPPDVVRTAQSRGRALDIWDTAAKLLDDLEKLDWSSTETLV